MTDLKKKIIDRIIDTEGGYVNDADDSGGETNYGITKQTALINGYTADMIDLPHSFAFGIYSREYWDSVRADNLLKISENICLNIVDICVNIGPYYAGTILQRALNIFNDRENLYNDIDEDAIIGDKTTDALKFYLDTRSEEVLIKLINALKCQRYIEVVKESPKNEKFIYGWIKQRVDL